MDLMVGCQAMAEWELVLVKDMQGIHQPQRGVLVEKELQTTAQILQIRLLQMGLLVVMAVQVEQVK